MQAGLKVVAIGAGGLGLVAVAPARGLAPAQVFAAGAVLAVALAWYGVWVPGRRAWDLAGDPRGHARRAEALAPALQGRLITAAGRLDGPRGAESPVLLERVARRALDGLIGLRDAEVVPARPMTWQALGAVLSLVLAGVLVQRAPGGVHGVAAWLVGERGAAGVVAAPSAEVEALARVGDLTLRYTYPPYTGLDPYEVPNSNGEVRAVPGTRVEVIARSAEAVDAAALQAYDQEGLEVLVDDDRRTMRAAFTVAAGEGAWRLRTEHGGQMRTTSDHPILPEADLPPEVVLDLGDRLLRIPADEPVRGAWEARDDFGVSKVVLAVDGRPVRRLDENRPGRAPQLGSDLWFTPRDLGLMPGSTYTLRIQAWDNDTVSGAKVGESEAVELIVLDEEGLARLDEARRVAMLDLVVDALGDFLEEPFPVGSQERTWARWGQTVHRRMKPLAEALAPFRSEFRGVLVELEPVEDALQDALALVRFTQVAFRPDATAAADDSSVQTAIDHRDEVVAGLEDAAMYLDGMLNAAAIRSLTDVARSTERRGGRLAALLDPSTGDGLDDPALGLELSAAREQVVQLDGVADRLRDPGLREMVRDRGGEIDRVSESAQQALVDADAALSRTLGRRVGLRQQDFGRAVREELARRQKKDEETQQQGQNLVELLTRIAEDEEALVARTKALREARNEGLRSQAEARWDAASGRVDVALEGISRLRDRIDEDDRFNESQYLDFVQSVVQRMRGAVLARDLAGAQSEGVEAEDRWIRFMSRRMHLQRGLSATESRIVESVRRALSDGFEELEALRRLDAKPVPGEQEELRSMVPTQASLRGQLMKATGMAEQLVRRMPVTPRGLMEALEAADERMVDAQDGLSRLAVLEVEGSQAAAARHVREAIEAFKQAAQQMQQMAREASGAGGGPPSQGQGGGGESEGSPSSGLGGEDLTEAQARLAEIDEEVRPEDYRQMLLEGMEGDVPDSFEALKKRYYEDLVHQ